MQVGDTVTVVTISGEYVGVLLSNENGSVEIEDPRMILSNPNDGSMGFAKGLAATGTPLGIAALEPLYIASQVAEGDSLGEIATNPLNYLGPAFAETLTKEATFYKND